MKSELADRFGSFGEAKTELFDYVEVFYNHQMLVIVPLWSASPPETVRAFFQGTDYNRTIFNFFGPPFIVARNVPVVAALLAG